MNLEVGRRFRLGSCGPIVEIVPDAVAILTGDEHSCSRCFIKRNGYSSTYCMWVIGCISCDIHVDYAPVLSEGLPRILKEVEDGS